MVIPIGFLIVALICSVEMIHRREKVHYFIGTCVSVTLAVVLSP